MQTELNNWIYNEKKNVFSESVTSGIAGAGGYVIGDRTTKYLLGGASAGTLNPYIWGNIAGPASSEVAQSELDNLMHPKPKDSKK